MFNVVRDVLVPLLTLSFWMPSSWLANLLLALSKLLLLLLLLLLPEEEEVDDEFPFNLKKKVNVCLIPINILKMDMAFFLLLQSVLPSHMRNVWSVTSISDKIGWVEEGKGKKKGLRFQPSSIQEKKTNEKK